MELVDLCIAESPLITMADFQNQLKRLEQIESEPAHRFKNIESAEWKPLGDRVVAVLERFEQQGFDVEAALGIFACSLYLTDNNLEALWRKTLEQLLEKTDISDRENLVEQAAFFQCDGEDHIMAFLRANKFEGRQDPERFSYYNSVQRLEDLRKDGLAANATSDDQRQVIKKLLSKQFWVLLWDLNLSGKTVSTEMKRLIRYAGLFSRYTIQFYICCAIATEDAYRQIRKSIPYPLEMISGLTLNEGLKINSPNCRLLSPEWRARACKLCERFFSEVIAVSRQPEILSYIKKGGDGFGYKSGGYTLVTQQNCPNNTLPLYWLNLTEPKYIGPFLRKPSRISHISLAPRELDEKNEAELLEERQIMQTYLYIENCVTSPDGPEGLFSSLMKHNLLDRIVKGIKKFTHNAQNKNEIDDLIQRINTLTKTDLSIWQELLNLMDSLLVNKIKDMSFIHNLLESYEAVYAGRDDMFSTKPSQELIFRQCQLRTANHEGRIPDIALRRRIEELEGIIAKCNPNQSLESTLHRAVSEFNAFNFNGAWKILSELENDDRLPGVDAKTRGALFSSFGQVQAFCGNSRDANAYFNKALDILDTIDDAAERLAEREQTLYYKAINCMDSQIENPLSILESYIGPMENFASKWGASEEPRYKQHAFVRYLYYKTAHDAEIVKHYIALESAWKDIGYPYHLINLYRALLLQANGREDTARSWLNRAIAQTVEAAEPLHFDSLVITAIGWHLGLVSLPKDRCQEQIRQLSLVMPQIKDRLEAVEKLLNEPPRNTLIHELNWLLPFYYH